MDARGQDPLQVLGGVGAGEARAGAGSEEPGDMVVEPEEVPLPRGDRVVHGVPPREADVEDRDLRLVRGHVLAVDECNAVRHGASFDGCLAMAA